MDNDSQNQDLLALGIGLILVVGAAIMLKGKKTPPSAAITATPPTSTAPDQSMSANDTVATPSTTAKVTLDGQVKVINVQASSFAFNPAEITVNKGDKVRIVLTNASGNHNWVIDEFNAKTKTIQSGQTDQVEFTASKAGTFEYYCAVANHRQMGMVGKLIVL